MKHRAMPLPWTLDNVPHAVLDILRGCNITCRDCYNSRPDHLVSLAEVETQLDTLQRLRRLQSVSVVGGEITLHPELVEIVRLIHNRGLSVELFSNGVTLDDRMLARLKQAGANVIFLHIEAHQRRPDLLAHASSDDVRRLRLEKAAMVAAHGIDAGLAITAYPDNLDEIEAAVAITLESPHLCYLLVTMWRDITRMPAIRGDLRSGLLADAAHLRHFELNEEIVPEEIMQMLATEFGLEPFTVLGSNVDPLDPRWFTFLIATAHRQNHLSAYRGLRSTRVEPLFLEISRRTKGRYPFYQQQSSVTLAAHMLLNGVSGGGLVRNSKFLLTATGAKLSAKRILFQRPATFDKEGRLIHCRCCPDAVVKNGNLVPLCISDRVSAVGNEADVNRRVEEAR